MKIPDASHPIAIAPAEHRVRITHRGKVIADTRKALALKEASYPVVHYIPREDIDFTASRSISTVRSSAPTSSWLPRSVTSLCSISS